jgi:hypothetical protein
VHPFVPAIFRTTRRRWSGRHCESPARRGPNDTRAGVSHSTLGIRAPAHMRPARNGCDYTWRASVRDWKKTYSTRGGLCSRRVERWLDCQGHGEATLRRWFVLIVREARRLVRLRSPARAYRSRMEPRSRFGQLVRRIGSGTTAKDLANPRATGQVHCRAEVSQTGLRAVGLINLLAVGLATAALPANADAAGQQGAVGLARHWAQARAPGVRRPPGRSAPKGVSRLCPSFDSARPCR